MACSYAVRPEQLRPDQNPNAVPLLQLLAATETARAIWKLLADGREEDYTTFLALAWAASGEAFSYYYSRRGKAEFQYRCKPMSCHDLCDLLIRSEEPQPWDDCGKAAWQRLKTDKKWLEERVIAVRNKCGYHFDASVVCAFLSRYAQGPELPYLWCEARCPEGWHRFSPLGSRIVIQGVWDGIPAESSQTPEAKEKRLKEDAKRIMKAVGSMFDVVLRVSPPILGPPR